MRPNRTSNRRRAAIGALVVGIFILLGASALSTLTASANVDPVSNGDQSAAVQPNDLRPQECITQNISVARVISGGAVLNGQNDGDLLLAGTMTTDIVAGTANDCIVGGDAANIDGGGGTDVCIGNQTAVFANCEVEVRQ